MSAESSIVIIDDVGGVFIVCLIVDRMDDQLFICVSYFVVCGLVSAIVVDSGPRSHWPDIVQLPIKTTHVVRLVQSQTSDCHFQCV